MAVGWEGVINHTEWALPMKYLPKYFSWRFNPDQDGPPEPNWAKPRPEIRAANKEDPEATLDSPGSSNDGKGQFSSAPENHTLTQNNDKSNTIINTDQSTTSTAPNSTATNVLGSDAHAQHQGHPMNATEQRVPGTSPTVMGGGQNDTYKSTTVQPAETNSMTSEPLNYLRTLKQT
ncbi:hypothetical protein MYAM1_000499 [Malassezia yamatoensis]|uniref:Uncharacterized protein n=1 Tax=Malassezia yamatoensis TaxID=253288 RepID=A0AAJ6CG20_9BASI|nr:hypothetical protein MYAM1_000499 [Malassezia yamatoensis]